MLKNKYYKYKEKYIKLVGGTQIINLQSVIDSNGVEEIISFLEREGIDINTIMIDGLNIFMYIWFKYRFKSGMLDLYPILLDKVQDNNIIKDTIIYILFINKNISINRCKLFYDKIEPFNIIEYLPTFTSRYSHLDLITDDIIITQIKSIIEFIIHACFKLRSSIDRLRDTMEELDIFEILVKQLNPDIVNQSVIKYINEREHGKLEMFDPDFRKEQYRNDTNRPTVQIVLPIIFKILLDNGLDPNNIYNISKLTSPLINIICKYNNIELIELFCLYDTNFYITDNSGKRAIDYMTPETLSRFQTQIESIRLPEIQPIIEINMSLFMRELVKDKLKEYLLENPEKINLKDENDRTLLYYINPDDTEIIEFLLENGIDTNFNDEMIYHIIYNILFPKRDIEDSSYKKLIEYIDFNSDTIHRIFIENDDIEDIEIIDYLLKNNYNVHIILPGQTKTQLELCHPDIRDYIYSNHKHILTQWVEIAYENFIDPITHELLEDPYIASDGVTYSKSSLDRLFTQHNRRGVQGQVLILVNGNVGIPNLSMRQMMDKFKLGKLKISLG